MILDLFRRLLPKRERRVPQQKVIFTSIPHCGTHILLSYFDIMGFRHIGPFGELLYTKSLQEYLSSIRHGDYISWHYVYDDDFAANIRELQAKVVFLYRDPRANACSKMHFIMRETKHPLHRLFTQYLKTDHDRLIRVIKGIPEEELRMFPASVGDWDSLDIASGKGPCSEHPRGLNSTYRFFARWLDEPFTFPVRFEDIIGPQGSGSRERQIATLRALTRFTGARDDAPPAEALAESLFNENSDTFRKGQIDSWKEEFTPEITNIFTHECKELLSLWGYDDTPSPGRLN